MVNDIRGLIISIGQMMKAFRKRAKRINLKYLEQSLRYPVAVIFLLILLILLAEKILSQELIEVFTVYDWALLGGGFLGLFLTEWLESRFYPRPPYPANPSVVGRGTDYLRRRYLSGGL